MESWREGWTAGLIFPVTLNSWDFIHKFPLQLFYISWLVFFQEFDQIDNTL